MLLFDWKTTDLEVVPKYSCFASLDNYTGFRCKAKVLWFRGKPICKGNGWVQKYKILLWIE